MITTESQDLVLLSLIPLSIKLPITDLNKQNYSILNNNQRRNLRFGAPNFSWAFGP